MNINPAVNDACIVNDFHIDKNQKQTFNFIENEPGFSRSDPHVPFKNKFIQKK